jgi:hypothetical protein
LGYHPSSIRASAYKETGSTNIRSIWTRLVGLERRRGDGLRLVSVNWPRRLTGKRKAGEKQETQRKNTHMVVASSSLAASYVQVADDISGGSGAISSWACSALLYIVLQEKGLQGDLTGDEQVGS